jgi:hypothetical protein
MKTFIVSYALSISAAALLAGCGGSQPPIGVPGAMPQSRAIATLANRGGSWMLPDATDEDLLYVSTQNPGNVHVFAYPSNKKVGEIANVSGDECVDSKGDVFITNGTKVLGYRHGETKPFKKLSYSNLESPDSCAVDPKTGDLAVTNSSSGNPVVFIFHHAKQHVKYYYDSNLWGLLSCAYDDKGNLFIDDSANLAELPSNGSQLETITITGSEAPLSYIYGVQWDGKYLAIGDNESGGSRGVTGIYRLSVSGSTATIKGNVLLEPTATVSGFWIQGATLIAPGFNNPRCGRTGCVAFYPYPRGGKYTKYIQLGYPTAAAVSVAPSREP